MATAVVKTFNSIKVAGKQDISVGSHKLRSYTEGDSQAGFGGAPVIFSSGKVVEAATSAGVYAAAAVKIVGIAAQDFNNTTSNTQDKFPVVPVPPGIVFEGVLSGSTGTTHALAQSDVGTDHRLVRSDDKAWYLAADDDASKNLRTRIVGLKDAIGTAEGKVYFIFQSTGTDAAAAVTPGTIYA